ncbi:hypothetical protein OAL64_01415, partial [bacterium]|nr:hypothetical protein [bacterium]
MILLVQLSLGLKKASDLFDFSGSRRSDKSLFASSTQSSTLSASGAVSSCRASSNTTLRAWDNSCS